MPEADLKSRTENLPSVAVIRFDKVACLNSLVVHGSTQLQFHVILLELAAFDILVTTLPVPDELTPLTRPSSEALAFLILPCVLADEST